MKVVRKIKTETENFKLGDIISFTITTGEQVEAMAVREETNGMFFMSVDCLETEYPMFKEVSVAPSADYKHSDLRHTLNEEILGTFPKEIRDRMVAVNANGDLLRIPTEREIFGKNEYGVDEPKSVKQFYGMDDRRNRIAWQGLKTGVYEWYWLQNRSKLSAFDFADVIGNGYAGADDASDEMVGVRPVFLLRGDKF